MTVTFRDLRIWMCWRWAEQPDGTKFKLPLYPHGRAGDWAGSSTDPGRWVTYAQAKTALDKHPEWEGLAFALSDGVWVCDLDGCVVDGVIEPWAESIIARLSSYSEYSPSGTGVHIIVRGDATKTIGLKYTMGPGRRVELYTTAHYFTFTDKPVVMEIMGNAPAVISEPQERTQAFLKLRADVESKRATSSRKDSVPRSATKAATAAKAALGASTLTDDQVIDLAAQSAAGDRFKALMDGDASAYNDDHSSADMALCGYLAFWTRCDPEQIDRIFRKSDLMRNKWDTRRGLETYGEKTIQMAIDNCSEVYEGADTSTENFKDRMRARRSAKREKALASSVPDRREPFENHDPDKKLDSPVRALSNEIAHAIDRTIISQPMPEVIDNSTTIENDIQYAMAMAPSELEKAVMAAQVESVRDVQTEVTVSPNEVDPPEDGRYPELDDIGNADRLENRYRGKLLWSPSAGWMYWDGRRWAIGDHFAHNAAIETARSIMTEAIDPRIDADKQKNLFKHYHDSAAQGKRASMLATAEKRPAFFTDARMLDSQPMFLNLLNGTLNLETGQLMAHDPEQRITKLAPVRWIPDARSDLWERFLKEATTGQEGLAEFLQRAVGYTLTGLTLDDTFFVVKGNAGTGKTTFTGAILNMLGDYAVTMRSEVIVEKLGGSSGHQEEIAVLAGARMVLSSETNASDKIKEGLVKGLTGREQIGASRKHGHHFWFRPQMKLWLAANDMPQVRSDDTGTWRRIHKISFDHVFRPPDPRVRDALHESPHHREAILAWAVEGTRLWQAEGLKPPASVIEATAELRRSMDRLSDFFEDVCYFGDPAILWAASEELSAAYTRWAQDHDVPERYRPSLRSPIFQNALTQRGAIPKKFQGRRGWQGVVLKPVEEQG